MQVGDADPAQKVQGFDCLVVIDFEATCDQGDDPKVTSENQEIIEFPWVVIDLQSHAIFDEQQVYVKPEWSKELTPFCIEMTGITDDKLRDAPRLIDAIAQFNHYVDKHFTSKGKSFCILTDGEWDLKVCFLRDTRKKNIQTAPFFRQYFDLKNEFLKVRPLPYRPSLRQMVEALGLKFEGRHHSGLDDCRNISNVVLKLLEFGHCFEEPLEIPEDYDPSTDNAFVDYNKNPSLFARLPDGSDAETNVVVLRGLPWSVAEEQIEEFFGEEFAIVEGGIHLVNNRSGRPSGIAYVEFETVEHARHALSKGGQNLGERYIEIYLSDAKKMNAILDHQRRVSGTNREDVRPGDWHCQSCGDHQFASRTQCRKCGALKPGLAVPEQIHHPFASGSHPQHTQYYTHAHPHTNYNYHPQHALLQAPYQQHHQLQQHRHFMTGGTVNGGGESGGIAPRPGDWACPRCNDLNFASRKVCRKCKTPALHVALPPQAVGFIQTTTTTAGGVGGGGGGRLGMQGRDARPPDIRPGDWECVGCGDFNFASRKVCRRCNQPPSGFQQEQASGSVRGGSSGGSFAKGGGGSGEFREGDWYCPSCGDLNFASRVICRKCGSPPSHVHGGAMQQRSRYGWQ